ncbi:UNVERIFIED_CONTAM: hypothetical protein Sindi_0959100, partial [Sesamum indicum]
MISTSSTAEQTVLMNFLKCISFERPNNLDLLQSMVWIVLVRPFVFKHLKQGTVFLGCGSQMRALVLPISMKLRSPSR